MAQIEDAAESCGGLPGWLETCPALDQKVRGSRPRPPTRENQGAGVPGKWLEGAGYKRPAPYLRIHGARTPQIKMMNPRMPALSRQSLISVSNTEITVI